MTETLTEERLEQTVQLTERAERTHVQLLESRHFLEQCEAAVKYWRENSERLARLERELDQKLRELGYHDLGHARGVIQAHMRAVGCTPHIPSANAQETCHLCGQTVEANQ